MQDYPAQFIQDSILQEALAFTCQESNKNSKCQSKVSGDHDHQPRTPMTQHTMYQQESYLATTNRGTQTKSIRTLDTYIK